MRAAGRCRTSSSRRRAEPERLAGGWGCRRRPAATADARAAAAGIAGPLGRRRRAVGRTRTRAVACAATMAAWPAGMGAAAAPTTRAASTAAAPTTTAGTTAAAATATGTTTATTTAGLSPGGQTASVRAGQRHDRESRP